VTAGDAFRDPGRVKDLAATIAGTVAPEATYRLMEFCGGHTHAIARHGLDALLPPQVRLIHGPGCPVCVLPVSRLAGALHIADQPGTILATYGDMIRVPGPEGRSLMRAKADGADVRIVYSPLDALTLARDNPDRTVVFFAIGFETTTPPTAVAVQQAAAEGLANFRVFCNHVMTPPAMRGILDDTTAPPLDGIIGPGHVSTIIGTEPYREFAEGHGVPVAVTGFEPLDLLHAVYLLVKRVNAGEAGVDNAYGRALDADGNPQARRVIDAVFIPRESFAWRGLGHLPHSALALRDTCAAFDAERTFSLPDTPEPEPRGCACPGVIRGRVAPEACRLFGTECTPENPVGACMVSSEGACAARWRRRGAGRKSAAEGAA